jgi:uncharacterized protein (UPF0332 family)
MTAENARDNARQEMRHGDQALLAARHLLEGGFYNDAISRAYYAAYHWARALLLSRGLDPKTHRGVIQLISLHYVKEGGLSDEQGALLAHLETYRELCDYTSSADFSEAQAREELARAERFIAACRPLVRSL